MARARALSRLTMALARFEAPEDGRGVVTYPPVDRRCDLSPEQYVWLRHARSAGTADDARIHVACRCGPSLDIVRFERAWQYQIQRQSMLRTSFQWHRTDTAVQRVHTHVACPVIARDIRDSNEEGRGTALSEIEAGLEWPEVPPLYRLTLFRVADDEQVFVWTYHPLLLDDYSCRLVLRDVATCYDAPAQPHVIAARPTPAYDDYVAWEQRQEIRPAQDFWKQCLAPGAARIRLNQPSVATWSASRRAVGRHTLTLWAPFAERLRAVSRRYETTLQVLLQAAWAIVLSRHLECEEVVFGVTTPGRGAAFPQMRALVGFVARTLPRRVTVDPGQPVLVVLDRLRTQQHLARRLCRGASMPRPRDEPWGADEPLFDSVVAFRGRSASDSGRDTNGGVWAGAIGQTSWPGCPLLLTGHLAPDLTLALEYDPRRFEEATAGHLLCMMAGVLKGVATNPEGRVATYPGRA